MAQVQAFIAQAETQPADRKALPSTLAMGCKSAAAPSADVSQHNPGPAYRMNTTLVQLLAIKRAKAAAAAH